MNENEKATAADGEVTNNTTTEKESVNAADNKDSAKEKAEIAAEQTEVQTEMPEVPSDKEEQNIDADSNPENKDEKEEETEEAAEEETVEPVDATTAQTAVAASKQSRFHTIFSNLSTDDHWAIALSFVSGLLFTGSFFMPVRWIFQFLAAALAIGTIFIWKKSSFSMFSKTVMGALCVSLATLSVGSFFTTLTSQRSVRVEERFEIGRSGRDPFGDDDFFDFFDDEDFDDFDDYFPDHHGRHSMNDSFGDAERDFEMFEDWMDQEMDKEDSSSSSKNSKEQNKKTEQPAFKDSKAEEKSLS